MLRLAHERGGLATQPVGFGLVRVVECPAA